MNSTVKDPELSILEDGVASEAYRVKALLVVRRGSCVSCEDEKSLRDGLH